MKQLRLRIATRTSALALWQADFVAGLIRTLEPDVLVEQIPVVTTGDQNQTDALRQFGGTGVFTREVQKAVLDERADVAVHSLKDLPTESAEGLVLASVPERECRWDAIVLAAGAATMTQLKQLPECARIGTGSPRRQAQLLHHRPDLRPLEIRGNVDTRLKKLDDGHYDAIVLAEAGLRRLGLADRISFRLQPPLIYPAVGQGALGIECRVDDHATRTVLSRLTCADALAEVTAERSLLRTLRAGCHAPLGAWTQVHDGRISLTGVLLSLDGVRRSEATADAAVAEADQLGRSVAESLQQAANAVGA